MRLEPKPAIQATLYLVLLVGYIVSLAYIPPWVVAAVMLPIWLGALWWLIYTGLNWKARRNL